MGLTIEELMRKTHFLQDELEGMQTLQNVDSVGGDLSDDNKTLIQRMLGMILGNRESNTKLFELCKCADEGIGIGEAVLFDLRNLTYRTRYLHKIEPELDGIWDNFQSIRRGEYQPTHDKRLTLKQFGMLYDLAEINQVLERYNDLGLITGDSRLETLYQYTKKAKTMINYFDENFQREYKAPTGAVVLTDAKKRALVYGRKLSTARKMLSVCMKYDHAAKVVSFEENEKTVSRISHLHGEYYVNAAYALRDYLYSDSYTIKLEKLIHADTQKLFKTHFGPDWLTYLEAKYAEIERDLHDGTIDRYPHLETESGKGRFSSMGTVYLHGGHKNFFFKDHSNTDVRDEIYGRGKWNNERKTPMKIICSEFIGKTIIASIQELNDVIKQELLDKGVTAIPDNMIRSPLSTREKLDMLSPDRLVAAMEKRGAIEKVNVSRTVNQYIKIMSQKTQTKGMEHKSQDSVDDSLDELDKGVGPG